MRHPEVLLAPLLMVADYYLTLLGAYLAEQSYRRRFNTAHYELNPFWQSAMVRRQWINLRHLAGVVLVGSLLVLLTDVSELDDVFLNTLIGFVLTCYGLVLGRHLSNILTFVHLARSPDDVTGEIQLSHNFVLSLSIYQLLVAGVPIGFIAIFSPSDFVFGAFAAVVALALVNTLWLARAAKTGSKRVVESSTTKSAAGNAPKRIPSAQ
jgi:hypothetical protein